jgi:hypothetical protein
LDNGTAAFAAVSVATGWVGAGGGAAESEGGADASGSCACKAGRKSATEIRTLKNFIWNQHRRPPAERTNGKIREIRKHELIAESGTPNHEHNVAPY